MSVETLGNLSNIFGTYTKMTDGLEPCKMPHFPKMAASYLSAHSMFSHSELDFTSRGGVFYVPSAWIWVTCHLFVTIDCDCNE